MMARLIPFNKRVRGLSRDGPGRGILSTWLATSFMTRGLRTETQ